MRILTNTHPRNKKQLNNKQNMYIFQTISNKIAKSLRINTCILFFN